MARPTSVTTRVGWDRSHIAARCILTGTLLTPATTSPRGRAIRDSVGDSWRSYQFLDRVFDGCRGWTEDFCGGDDRVGVDGHGVFDAGGVAAGVRHENGEATSASGAKDQLVALLQAVDCEIQSAKLIFAERIGSGDVADQLGLELSEAGAQGVIEPGEVFGVAAAVGKIHIN